jgi:hypothetical protein
MIEMSDIDHVFGSDLAVTVSGDLAAVSGSTLGQQRVLRRLLTNAGDYIWKLTYGAGLPSVIGMPVDAAAVTGLVRSQIFLESAVAQTPTPVIDVQAAASSRSRSHTPTRQT